MKKMDLLFGKTGRKLTVLANSPAWNGLSPNGGRVAGGDGREQRRAIRQLKVLEKKVATDH